MKKTILIFGLFTLFTFIISAEEVRFQLYQSHDAYLNDPDFKVDDVAMIDLNGPEARIQIFFTPRWVKFVLFEKTIDLPIWKTDVLERNIRNMQPTIDQFTPIIFMQLNFQEYFEKILDILTGEPYEISQGEGNTWIKSTFTEISEDDPFLKIDVDAITSYIFAQYYAPVILRDVSSSFTGWSVSVRRFNVSNDIAFSFRLNRGNPESFLISKMRRGTVLGLEQLLNHFPVGEWSKNPIIHLKSTTHE